MKSKKILCLLAIVVCLFFPSIGFAEKNDTINSNISISTTNNSTQYIEQDSKENAVTQSNEKTTTTSSTMEQEFYDENDNGSSSTETFDMKNDTISTTDKVKKNQVKTDESYIDNTNYGKSRSDLSSSANLRQGVMRSSIYLPAVSASNPNTPRKDFIDVSSHNGAISVNEYREMMKYGVQGVIVKLTEATSYRNPYAKSQILNAKKAGLNVSAYHYSWFTTSASAIKEADYFVKYAKELGLGVDTVMVNDLEEPKIEGNKYHSQNSLSFEKRLKENGYSNVCHYFGASWIDNGKINTALLGKSKIWAAAYFYSITTSHKYTHLGSWQWSPRLSFPGIKGEFDISADYSKYFTKPVALKKGTSVILKKDASYFVSGNSISETDRKKAYIITGSKVITGQNKIIYNLKGLTEQVYGENIQVQTSSFPYISLGKTVSIKPTGNLDIDGNVIVIDDKKKIYTIKAVKDIPKKYASIRAYQLKENGKWYYEADIQEQNSSFKQQPNGMSFKIKSSANLFYDGTKISSNAKKNIGVITNMKLIPKKYNSIRIYQDSKTKKYLYESDITPLYSEIPRSSSIVIKANAYYYQSGGQIPSNYKNSAFIVTDMKNINQKYNSVRAYRIRNTNNWLYENDIIYQTSVYPYISLGSKVYLKQSANLDYSGRKIESSDRGKVFKIGSVRDIPKKYGSIRIYQDSKTKRWYYEADINKV